MLRRITAIAIVLIFVGCKSPSENCICTTEFHTITVTVVDTQGVPIDSVEARTVNQWTGKVYRMDQDFGFGAGKYVVYSDAYIKELDQTPAPYLFMGQKGNLSFESEFLVNTDECHCHVQKIAGPDTVVVSK